MLKIELHHGFDQLLWLHHGSSLKDILRGAVYVLRPDFIV